MSAIRREYLEKGTPGLREFVLIRLGRNAAMGAVQKLGWDQNKAMSAMSSAPGSPDRNVFDSAIMLPAYDAAARSLAAMYLARKSYYDAIRPNLIAVDTAEK